METIARYLELAERTAARGITLYTRFLDLNGQKEAVIASNKAGVQYRLFGGARECERQVLAFYDIDKPEDGDFPIRCVCVKPRSQHFGKPLAHRDVLGSVMSLGLEREMLGDIVIADGCAWLFCLDAAARMITDSLTQVGGTDVYADISDAPASAEKKTEQIILQVTSPRTDAVVAHLFHLSRGDTDEMFRQGRIMVNDAPCLKNEKQLTAGDVLSVRGYGRAKYIGLKSLSKKGKQNIIMALYR